MKRFDEKTDEGILQDLEIRLHGFDVCAGISCDIGKVDDLAVALRSDCQESPEGVQIAHQVLGPDFLLEVGQGVGSEEGVLLFTCSEGRQPGQGAICFGTF